MRIASIDLGTNTLRILIANVKENRLYPLFSQNALVRIGEGISKQKLLKVSAVERTISALEGFKKKIDEFQVQEVLFLATSALREAENRDVFLKKVKKIGFSPQIINAKKEAELTTKGALFLLKEKYKLNNTNLFFDLGGGSTEFVIFDKGIKHILSIPQGVVKLTESFLLHDSPAKKELDKLRDFVGHTLSESLKDFLSYPIEEIVGDAGTVTTLSVIALKLKKYDEEKSTGFHLKKKKIEELREKMVRLTAKERLHHFPILEKGREDVIVSGCIFLEELLDLSKKDEIISTDGGLREGIIVERFSLPWT